MDLMKLRMYIELLAISATVGGSCLFIANIVFGMPEKNDAFGIGVLAFCWVVVLTCNQSARVLWDKWTKKI
jgi:hypothetical protein